MHVNLSLLRMVGDSTLFHPQCIYSLCIRHIKLQGELIQNVRSAKVSYSLTHSFKTSVRMVWKTPRRIATNLIQQQERIQVTELPRMNHDKRIIEVIKFQ